MDVYEEIASFFNETVEEAKRKCAERDLRLRGLWMADNPVSEAERTLWYRTTNAHIYEGAYWHSKDFASRKKIGEKANGKILCFGAGIGTEGILAAEMGKEVTFYDLQSLIFNFLKHRVNLRNLKNIKFIDQELVKKEKAGAISYENQLFETYDTIICIDVLEHLEYPQEILNFLGRRLKPSGRLLISAPFGALEYPGHLKQNSYLDIDLMMHIAKIKNYRKEILSPGAELGIAPPFSKVLLLNLLSILPVNNSWKHKIIYFLRSIAGK